MSAVTTSLDNALFSYWKWEHDFPHAWRSICRIFRQQFVQKSRTAARHSRHENGLANRVLYQLRILAPFFVQSQSSFQDRLQMQSHQETAEGMQLRFLFQALGQNA